MEVKTVLPQEDGRRRRRLLLILLLLLLLLLLLRPLLLRLVGLAERQFLEKTMQPMLPAKRKRSPMATMGAFRGLPSKTTV